MKRFKSATVIAAAVSMSMTLAAQNTTFEKIAELPEAEYAYIPESMLSSMGSMADESRPGFDIASTVGMLKSLEIISCDRAASFHKIRSMLNSCIDGMQIISRADDKYENIEIYGAPNGDKLSSLLLIIGKPDELSAVYMTGDIDPDALKSMTRNAD